MTITAVPMSDSKRGLSGFVTRQRRNLVQMDQRIDQNSAGSNLLMRSRMQSQGMSKSALSRATQLDERTIQRSLDGETMPQAQNALAIADALNCKSSDLWPNAFVESGAAAEGTVPALIYASRAQIPVGVWHDLFAEATTAIDICVYGGTFLFDVIPGFGRLITDAVGRGVHIRFVAGDPGSNAVHQRGVEESIGTSLSGRCALTLDRLAAVADMDGVEICIHGTPLYASIFRVDDTIVANHHIYGSPASDNPAMLLRREQDAELWDKYEASFEKVWARARPARYSSEGEY
jgi:lambda repressor-like predicted transcriptional regulator